MNRLNKTPADDGAARVRPKTKRFNFIDVLIILAVLLVIAVVASIFMPKSWLGGSGSKVTREIQYTVEFVGITGEFADLIEENDNVVDAVSKFSLGSVTAVDGSAQYGELRYNELTRSGEYTYYPDRYNLLVTVTVSAEYIEGEGYYVNDRRIAVGEALSLRFPDYVAEGYCIGISALD